MRFDRSKSSVSPVDKSIANNVRSVIALSKLYSLNDPRLVQTMVKGDLVIPTSDRIMTRSQAKLNPDQFTIIPAPLKILKVLIEELLSASGLNTSSSNLASAAQDYLDEEDDDGWEDLPSSANLTFDLGLGSTKESLMAFGNGEGRFDRQRDDETQGYLIEFFVRAGRENIAGFEGWYAGLTDDERRKLEVVAGGGQASQ
jgi:hypothetical protein